MTEYEELVRDLRRQADDADARSAAKWAAASTAAAHDIRGLSDPAYIANVIEAELRRFEKDPAAPLIERPWKGPDPATTLHEDEAEDWAEQADATAAAMAAAIRIVRTYSTAIAIAAQSDSVGTFGRSIVDIAERIQHYLDIPEQPPELAAALQAINAHRRALGMSPLDPQSSGWTDEDLLIEGERIARLANLGRLLT